MTNRPYQLRLACLYPSQCAKLPFADANPAYNINADIWAPVHDERMAQVLLDSEHTCIGEMLFQASLVRPQARNSYVIPACTGKPNQQMANSRGGLRFTNIGDITKSGDFYELSLFFQGRHPEFRGSDNGAFGKPCFCPARQRGFLTKMAKMTNLHSNQ